MHDSTLTFMPHSRIVTLFELDVFCPKNYKYPAITKNIRTMVKKRRFFAKFVVKVLLSVFSTLSTYLIKKCKTKFLEFRNQIQKVVPKITYIFL